MGTVGILKGDRRLRTVRTVRTVFLRIDLVPDFPDTKAKVL